MDISVSLSASALSGRFESDVIGHVIGAEQNDYRANNEDYDLLGLHRTAPSSRNSQCIIDN